MRLKACVFLSRYVSRQVKEVSRLPLPPRTTVSNRTPETHQELIQAWTERKGVGNCLVIRDESCLRTPTESSLRQFHIEQHSSTSSQQVLL